MDSTRRIAVVAGVLYLVGDVAGVLSMIVMQGRLNGVGYLERMASNASPIMVGALLMLVMGLALAMVPVAVFPVLRRHSETLAIGHVVFRGALETVLYIATAMSWLLLVVVARQYVEAGAASAAQLSSLGTTLAKAGDPIIAVRDIVFSLGALMFYYRLYQARLIPRWISGWGLAEAALYLTAGLIAVFSTERVILLMLLALQEVVMAVWLIAKGFNPSASASDSDRQPRATDWRASAST